MTEVWIEIDRVLYHEDLLYLPEIIRTEIISRYHNDLLASYFRVKKTMELVAEKYYWPTPRAEMEVYVKRCDVYITSKAIKNKPCGDLQLLPVPTHSWKNLAISFVTGLLVSTNWKGKTYKFILVIAERLTKMVNYELVKLTINAFGLAEAIISVVMRHHGLLDTIISNRGSVFTSKFWSLLCYFLDIKQRLSTAFHTQTDGQTESQNCTMEVSFLAFVNYEQNDWARFFLMVEFSYSNAKNVSTGYTSSELNIGFHSKVSYKEDVDPYSRSKTANQLATEL